VTARATLAPLGALVRLPRARLLRTARTWIAALAWCGLGIAVAVEARLGGAARGADHALVGAAAAVVLPLLAYTVVGAALGGRSLSWAVAPVVAFGARPRRAALASIGLAALACALAGAVLFAAVALVAHGVGDPPPARDAVVSAYSGALGGAAYAAWLSLGATLGRRGGGRTLLLVLDYVLDAFGGAAALVTPRAHLRNLLGGEPAMGLPERASAVALVAIALACAVLAAQRTRPTE
jgi:hypothetical protein